ncbi:hypothetical protein F5Y14DRAFT_406792 [Nemania sp. NC0429]|nr:hypothetical protein F5Y14DRAFT_406792 [Nemania sp. NC0429]
MAASFWHSRWYKLQCMLYLYTECHGALYLINYQCLEDRPVPKILTHRYCIPCWLISMLWMYFSTAPYLPTPTWYILT